MRSLAPTATYAILEQVVPYTFEYSIATSYISWHLMFDAGYDRSLQAALYKWLQMSYRCSRSLRLLVSTLTNVKSPRCWKGKCFSLFWTPNVRQNFNFFFHHIQYITAVVHNCSPGCMNLIAVQLSFRYNFLDSDSEFQLTFMCLKKTTVLQLFG